MSIQRPWLKKQNKGKLKMDSETITVTVKGKPHYFNGDELTSPEQQAILFLKELDKEKESF